MFSFGGGVGTGERLINDDVDDLDDPGDGVVSLDEPPDQGGWKDFPELKILPHKDERPV